MTPLAAAALTAGVLVLLTAGLALNVSLIRLRDGIGVGKAGAELPKHLHHAVRAHGNAAEHVPILLFGLFAIAILGASTTWVLVAGAAAILCRVMHATGMLVEIRIIRLRFYATILTYSTMFALGIAAIILGAKLFFAGGR